MEGYQNGLISEVKTTGFLDFVHHLVFYKRENNVSTDGE